MKVAELPHWASPPPFVNEEAQARRGWVTCPGLHRVRPRPGTRTRPSDPKQGPLHNITLSPCKNPAGSLARKVGLSALALQGHSSQPGLQPGSIYISLTHPSYEFCAFSLLIPLHVDRRTVVGSIYGFSCRITNRHKPSNSVLRSPHFYWSEILLRSAESFAQGLSRLRPWSQARATISSEDLDPLPSLLEPGRLAGFSSL